MKLSMTLPITIIFLFFGIASGQDTEKEKFNLIKGRGPVITEHRENTPDVPSAKKENIIDGKMKHDGPACENIRQELLEELDKRLQALKEEIGLSKQTEVLPPPKKMKEESPNMPVPDGLLDSHKDKDEACNKVKEELLKEIQTLRNEIQTRNKLIQDEQEAVVPKKKVIVEEVFRQNLPFSWIKVNDPVLLDRYPGEWNLSNTGREQWRRVAPGYIEKVPYQGSSFPQYQQHQPQIQFQSFNQSAAPVVIPQRQIISQPIIRRASPMIFRSSAGACST